MPNHRSTLRKIIQPVLAISLLALANSGHAKDADFYAPSSRLSTGNWVKIEVSGTGMHYISDATLRSLGFSDPGKVNIYGYGGVVIPENLKSPDDLPVVATQRVDGGLMFFAQGNVGWNVNATGATAYSHLSHPYSDNSYYFISDGDVDITELPKKEIFEADGDPINVFTERLVHEQDLWMPMNTGRLMLGDDFKTAAARSFRLSLPGNTGDATITTAFGCKTASGTSSISFTANGKQLEATSSDKMAYSATKEIVTTTTIKTVEDAGEMLDLVLRFNPGGTVTKAGLDYIEVEYPRELKMTNGEIHFYLNPETNSIVELSGVSSTTKLWDITDKENMMVVPFELSGNKLTFVTDNGYHEYIAFEPGKINREITSGVKVTNQDIHSMEAPGMLIISPAEYVTAAQRIADLHQKTDGLSVAVLTPEQIYNEFSCGKPDVSAFRKLLKMWYDRAEGREGEYTAYCIIMSRPTYDNKMVTPAIKNCGYPRVPIWQSATGETETTSYSTDDYIGMLKDVTGTFNIGTAEIHVAVARMPVKSLREANEAVDKLEAYCLNPDLGAWRNNVMVIADDQDSGVHLDQAEKVVEAFQSNGVGNRFIYEKLYLDSYTLEYTGVGATYPQAKERMMNKWKEGTVLVDYIGHANPKGWGHEYMLTWTDISSLSNNRLPYIYAATCEFMRWDADEVSGAEAMWLLPNAGVIGMWCPSREVLISSNGVLNRSVSQFMFAMDEEGKPLRVGEVMRRGKNESNTGTNKLRYGIIGDPSMRLPWPENQVVVDQINGIILEDAEDLPVLAARSNVTISGHITDKEGNIIDDFNGILELSLYDAEKVVSTNGNGNDGVVSTYNDRKTRLFSGRAKVVNGEWSTSFTMPMEIENNYSPAQFTFYASDENKREANGTTEKVYAYGYDESAPDDFEGPKILEFYLNEPGFVSGSSTNPNPVMTAVFYDESGISVSEAGIGHNITLQLDGKTFYEDVAQYYLPDDDEPGKGSVTYSLGNISQGEHRLRFTVWDNANNSTTSELVFNISALWKPSIVTLTTDANPATTNVNFIVGTDGASGQMDCMIDVYDMWGKKVWGGSAPSLAGINTTTTLNWNLCDFGGSRVPEGIYLYRATVKMENGATIAKTKKLVVR